MSAPLRHTMLALTVEPHPIGKRYAKVPSHVSVLPWMDLVDKRSEFMSMTREACAATEELELVPAGDMVVGAEGYEKPAQAIDCPELIKLHQHLFTGAVELGVEFCWPEWLGDGYNPHLTHGDLKRSLFIGRLTVIDNQEVAGHERGLKLISDTISFRSDW